MIDTQRQSELSAWPIAVLLLFYLGMWLYLTPYDGLNHDAQGYAAQSIAAVHPDPLAGDIFLLYRSQDEFTVFSTLYGRWIDLVGLDVAAVTLTLAFQFLWYLTAYLVLRRSFDTRIALLGLGLLFTMPCVYGGLRIFHLAEPFFTARTPGEVLSMLGLWAWLGRRWAAAGIALAAAAAVHPLIAFPAILLVIMTAAATRWDWRAPALLAFVGFVLAIGGAYLLGGDSPAMEGRWLAVTQMRSRFLFLNQWHAIDWNYALQSLLTMIIGTLALRGSRVSRVMLAACWLGIAGLALSWFYTAFVPLEVLIQGQPWRWIWPARFLAIGALPAIFLALWSKGRTDRAAALFLAAGWLFVIPLSSRASSVMMTSSMLLAISLGLALARGRVSDHLAGVTLRSAWVILGIVLLAAMIAASLAWYMTPAGVPPGSGVFAKIEHLMRVITPAVLLVTVAGGVTLYFWTPIRGALVVLVGLLLIVTAVPTAARVWLARTYTGGAHHSFHDWRDVIPRDAEVFWWERPREIWFLLERRAYLSRSQSGGVVFSEELADEIARRALVLEPLIVPDFWLGVQATVNEKPNPLTIKRLQAICRDPELGFVIWDVDLSLRAPRKTWPADGQTWYLYDCRAVRERASNEG